LKEVKLFEEQGETLRYLYAEIKDQGDISINGKDVGKEPL